MTREEQEAAMHEIASLWGQLNAAWRQRGTLQNALDTSDKLLEKARVARVDAEIKAAHQRERAEQAERELTALVIERAEWAAMARNLMAAVEQLRFDHIVLKRMSPWKSTSPWQPIETAPRDGTSIQIRHWDTLPINAFWKDGKWVQLEYQYPSHANPTHWAPIAPREQP